MLLYLSLMYKTLGGGSWLADFPAAAAGGQCAEDAADFCPIDSQLKVREC
jgi:hypothetical protein